MRKKIGNVLLDYKFYPGKDLYSDGSVEDELLEIASTYQEEQLNQVIDERGSWPVLYHFSNVRQNIVDWLPISKEDEVLEIGSGCGAITGALARMAKKVTCIELSEKRSLINANRNQKYDNIEIKLGNFQEVEQSLTQKYDYITLIGVFEYSQGYIGGEEPYLEMLKTVVKHLAPNGKLIIAIENRLGLKYWAGCTEDHFGTYYEGIQGYHNSSGVRTFSKKEWKNMLDEIPEITGEFYYPYPDYKFPYTIYSDDYLPRVGDLNMNLMNFDRERLIMFDEHMTYDTLIESDLFTEFSNSYLLVIERKQ